MVCYKLFVCFILGLITDSQKTNAAGCDSKVVERIESLWKEYGCPGNILENNVKYSPDILVYTTKDYLKDESDVTCSLTFWEKDSNGFAFRSITSWKNNRSSYSNLLPVVENDGKTYDAEGNRVVYHIPTSEKVSAFYACTEGLDVGLDLPEGVVKVNSGYSEEALETAVRRLEWALDRKLESKFDDRC